MEFKGALVGGPDNKDEYKDDRNDYEQSEVALDYTACFQGKDRLNSLVTIGVSNAIFPPSKRSVFIFIPRLPRINS